MLFASGGYYNVLIHIQREQSHMLVKDDNYPIKEFINFFVKTNF